MLSPDDDFSRRFRRSYQPPDAPAAMNDIRPRQSPRPPAPPVQRAAYEQPRRPSAAITQPPSARISSAPPILTTDQLAPSGLETAQTPFVAPLPALRRQQHQKTARPHRFRRLRRGIILAVVLLVVAAGIWFGAKLVGNLQRVVTGSIVGLFTTTKLKGEDTGRVNILLAGNSADDPGHDGANLTDSIMMVSLDVKTNSALLLSIPRDLWVKIPGYGHAKINEAYVDGQASHFSAPGYENGGMGLLAEVIEQNFGLATNYSVLVNYNALKQGVEAVGGLDITVQSDDPRGWYDPSIDWSTHGPLVKLSNGAHHISGQQALDLARARGDSYGSYGFPRSDFDRTTHQRLLMLALKQKVLTAGTLANPIALSKLFDSVGSNVKTNFEISDIRRLAELGKNLDSNSVQSIGLNDAGGKNLLANYASPTGQSTLIPAAGIDDFSAIKAYLNRTMSDDPLVREAATVAVLNGTATAGLATQTEKQLIDKHLNITGVGDAKAPTPTTYIIDATLAGAKKPGTLELLKSTLHATTVVTANPYAGTYAADYIVVLGNDWAAAVATQTAHQ